MSQQTTIRRSGARDIPPPADSCMGQVISQPAGSALPKPGSIVSVMTFSGVSVQARVVSVDAVENDWMAWGEILPGKESELRAAGVPSADTQDLLRIFSWKLQKS